MMKTIELTPKQAECHDAFKWLVNGERRSGRSFLLAVVSVETALENLGQWTVLIDHHPHRTAKILVADMIKEIFDKAVDTEKYNLEFHANVPGFRITLKEPQ